MQDDNDFVLARTDGQKEERDIRQGGTILEKTAGSPEQGYVTYHMGGLDHMSEYAVGAEKEDDDDDSDNCFIQTSSF